MARAKKQSERMAWFRFDPGAFLSVTTGLPAVHVGIYIRLLSLYWVSGNSFPSNMDALKRRICLSLEDEEAFKSVMGEFFPDGRNLELDLYLEEVKETSRINSENGKKAHTKKPDGNDTGDF